jgi:hypothetical protein
MRRWEDNIKIDLKNIVEICGLNYSGSGYISVVGPCEHGNEP